MQPSVAAGSTDDERSLSPPHTMSRADLGTRLARSALAWLTGLERPWQRYVLFAAALSLVSPTLFSGFAFDDYLFLYETGRRTQEWAGSAPFDLFRWVDHAHDSRLIDGQGLPWWTFDHTRVAFMRPVSSLTHALDYWLWPSSAFLMHLHSMAWFGLLLFVAIRTYRAVCQSSFVAAVAGGMFVLDSAHGASVGWISNRNALIGSVFGIATVWFHHRHRSRAGRMFAVLAPACLALGLCSCEAAIGITGYLLAYALFLERGPARARWLSLLPYAAVAATWVCVRRTAHYGVIGLGGYLDPFEAPVAFVLALPRRLVALLTAQIARISADLFDLVPLKSQPLLLIGAIICCGVAAWTAWPILRCEREARFWGFGALLSALPLTAAVPSDRLLAPVGLGVMAVIAHAIQYALHAQTALRSPLRSTSIRSDLALGLVLIHFVIDPLLLPWTALSPSVLARQAYALDSSLTSDPMLTHQTVIVAAIPDSWMLSYLPVMRSMSGRPRPDKLHWLAATREPIHLERPSANRLRVRSEHGFFDARWFERSSLLPLRRGERVRLSAMTVTVLEVTPDGRPLVCEFLFAQSLDSAQYIWLTYREDSLVPMKLPAIGEHSTIPGS